MPDRLRKKLKHGGFTAIDNGIFFDKRISLKARGLLCTALSLPEGWEFSVRGLSAICKDNRTAIESALRELEEAGYLRRDERQARGSDGRFGGLDYSFTDVPGDFPDTDTAAGSQHRADAENQQQADVDIPQRADVDFPQAEKARTENLPQENNKQENKQEINTPISPANRGDVGAASGGVCVKKPERRVRRSRSVTEWDAEGFEIFWDMYPRHEDRRGAVDVWDRLRPDGETCEAIFDALERQKASPDWRRGIGIPYALRWLRNRRWEDEAPEAASYDYSGGQNVVGLPEGVDLL